MANPLDKLMKNWSNVGSEDYLAQDAVEHQSQLRDKYTRGNKLSDEEYAGMSDEDKKKYKKMRSQL